jgi:hypothetical protein
MQRLAKRFGLSDVAIAKRCRKLNVPVPGRGYWARKAAGQRVRVIPLPPARAGEDHVSIEFAERSAEDVPVEIREGPVWEQEQFESRPENRITISKGLSRHPTIRATSEFLRERHNRHTAYTAPRDGILDADVSRALVTRALHFLDAFVRACEARGFSIRAAKGNERESVVTVMGQSMPFRLREPYRRIDLAKELRARGERPPEHMYPRHRDEKTGEFEFTVGSQYSIARRGWRDGKRQRVEDCLNEIMVALVEGAVALNEQAAQRAKEEAERARRARLAFEEQQQDTKYEQRVEQLTTDARGWAEASTLRAFASAVEADLLARSPTTPLPVDVAAWIAWVHWVADERDPLVSADPIAFLSREAPDPLPEWMRSMMQR